MKDTNTAGNSETTRTQSIIQGCNFLMVADWSAALRAGLLEQVITAVVTPASPVISKYLGVLRQPERAADTQRLLWRRTVKQNHCVPRILSVSFCLLLCFIVPLFSLLLEVSNFRPSNCFSETNFRVFRVKFYNRKKQKWVSEDKTCQLSSRLQLFISSL